MSFRVQRAKGPALKVPDITQAQINAGQEGWFTPAEIHHKATFLASLKVRCSWICRNVSGGKPPFLTCIYLSLSYVWELERWSCAR